MKQNHSVSRMFVDYVFVIFTRAAVNPIKFNEQKSPFIVPLIFDRTFYELSLNFVLMMKL